jgi:hypothetical protein
VMQHHSIQTATNEHNQIKRRLKICSLTPVGESYIDLLIDGFSRLNLFGYQIQSRSGGVCLARSFRLYETLM